MGLIATFGGQKLLPAKNAPAIAEDAYVFAASLTVVRGTLLGQITTGKKWTIYTSGASDGSQVAKAIAEYDFVTDSGGKVTLTSTAGQVGNEFGLQDLSAPVYIAGTFNTDELNINGVAGITSAALTDMGGHLVSGTLTLGVMTF
jgi:hypothetical protein